MVEDRYRVTDEGYPPLKLGQWVEQRTRTIPRARRSRTPGPTI